MTQFVNDYGLRNIVSKGLTNQGVHSNLMVGQMAMHNSHGTSNIGLGSVQAAGQNTNTAIGLMNLDSAELMNFKQAAPVFDNTNGQRLIAVKLLDNEGQKSISRVGELNMINKGGKADVNIQKAIAGGKATLTEIGLLNLAADDEDQAPKKAKKEKKPKKEEKPKKKAKKDDSDSDDDDDKKPAKKSKKAKKQEDSDSDDDAKKPAKKSKKAKKQEDSDSDDYDKNPAKKSKKSKKQDDSDSDDDAKKPAKKFKN